LVLIGIVCAIKQEAIGIVDRFCLKVVENEPFLIYQNRDFKLIVSGVGKLKSAIATTYLLSTTKCTKIINIGFCADSKGGVIGSAFGIKKVVDFATNKRYFSDYCYPFEIKDIITVDKPLEYPIKDNLIDMESSGFFEASFKFLPANKIALIKVVSDYCNTKEFNKNIKSLNLANFIKDII
jgi:nucleoside phosphorylase